MKLLIHSSGYFFLNIYVFDKIYENICYKYLSPFFSKKSELIITGINDVERMLQLLPNFLIIGIF